MEIDEFHDIGVGLGFKPTGNWACMEYPAPDGLHSYALALVFEPGPVWQAIWLSLRRDVERRNGETLPEKTVRKSFNIGVWDSVHGWRRSRGGLARLVRELHDLAELEHAILAWSDARLDDIEGEWRWPNG